MGRTLLTTREIGSVQRNDFDTTTSGQAVTTRIIAGTGITLSSTGVDTGTGDVTINSTGGGGGGLTYTEITGTTQTMAVDNGYIANNVALVTFTLPAVAVVGKIVRVIGAGAGGWRISQNASGIIHFGNMDTTTGTGGYVASTHRRDSIELICVVANNEWNVMDSQGNITVV